MEGSKLRTGWPFTPSFPQFNKMTGGEGGMGGISSISRVSWSILSLVLGSGGPLHGCCGNKQLHCPESLQ